MKNWPHRKIKGSIEIRQVEFPSLRGNPLRDPARRSVVVYLPPGYAREKKYPFIVALSGYLGTGLNFLNQDPLSPNLFERADALIAAGLSPFVLVCPDAFTRYGGSQYLNSSATGNYADLITRDLLRWIREEYSVFSRGGIMGHSSGGYGALVLSMKNPGLFKAVACHAGDMYFEWCYLPDFPRAAQTIAEYRSVRRFLDAFWKKEKPSSADVLALNVAAMSACYSPNPEAPGGFDPPFDPRTGALREAIWSQWLKLDPVRLVDRYGKGLKKLRLLFIDCGDRDEHFLHLGGRMFSAKLKSLGVRHVYQEFPDGHRGTGYRYSVSLPLLVKASAGGE